MTQQQEEQVLQLHDEGVSYRGIADLIGISKSKVGRFLKAMNDVILNQDEDGEYAYEEPEDTVPPETPSRGFDWGTFWITCAIIAALIGVTVFFIWLFWPKK